MQMDAKLDMEDVSAMAPEEAARHITIWNRNEGRKIAGNAAPLRRNLARYLGRHPECEVYKEQDKLLNAAGGGGGGYIDPVTGERLNEHVPIWHMVERRKVTGNAAPLKKNCVIYLQRHPEYELYNGQDKLPENRTFHAAAAAAAAAASNAAATAAAAVTTATASDTSTAGTRAAAKHHQPQHHHTAGSSSTLQPYHPVPALPVPVPNRPTAVSIASAVTGHGAAAAMPHHIPHATASDMMDAGASTAAANGGCIVGFSCCGCCGCVASGGGAHQPATSWTDAPFWPTVGNSSASVEDTAAIPIPARRSCGDCHLCGSTNGGGSGIGGIGGGGGGGGGSGMSMGATPPSLSSFLLGHTPNAPSFDAKLRMLNSMSMTISKTPAGPSSFNMTDFSPSRFLILGTPPPCGMVSQPPTGSSMHPSAHSSHLPPTAPAVVPSSAVGPPPPTPFQEGLAAIAWQADNAMEP